MSPVPPNPAELAEHDPAWSVRAEKVLDEVRAALAELPGGSAAAYDHIGSTSVPGLAAKPFIDLQVRMLPLPAHEDLVPRLARVGFRRERGSRPDSPGVDRDHPRGSEVVGDEVWEKRLYVCTETQAVLHVRRADSPWGRHTVWFRDWLRAEPTARSDYEATKRRLSVENRGKPDVDDYTRAKTAFFDRVQPEFTRWARDHR